MDRAYRVFQKGQDPKTGEVVTRIPLKSIITQPLPGEKLKPGRIVVLGAAYGGERELKEIEVSTDGGRSWAKGRVDRPAGAFCLAPVAIPLGGARPGRFSPHGQGDR